MKVLSFVIIVTVVVIGLSYGAGFVINNYTAWFKTKPNIIQKTNNLPTLSPQQQEQLTLLEKIVSEIRNPPPEIMKKYNITPEDIKQDNIVLLNGSDPKVLKEKTGKDYQKGSLLWVQEMIKNGKSKDPDVLGTLDFIFTVARNGALASGPAPSAPSRLPVKEIDPQGLRYKFAIEQPEVHVILPVHREDAIVDLIRLRYYYLPGIPFKNSK